MPMKLTLTQKAARNRERARLRQEAKQPGWLAARTEAQEAADYRAELKRLTKAARTTNRLSKKRKKTQDAKYRVIVLSGGAVETNRLKH